MRKIRENHCRLISDYLYSLFAIAAHAILIISNLISKDCIIFNYFVIMSKRNCRYYFSIAFFFTKYKNNENLQKFFKT